MRVRSKLENRSGQVIVLFVLSLFVVCLAAVLSIDFGRVTNTRARLQNAADAAALGAMLELWDQRVTGEDEGDARLLAEAKAAELASKNCDGTRVAVEFGEFADGVFVPLEDSVPATAARVMSARDPEAPGGPIRTSFGGLFGLTEVSQRATATARLRRHVLTPFSVYGGGLPPPGELTNFYNREEVAPGCFGLLNYDGGSGSAEEARRWTLHGYDGEFDFDPAWGYDWINGTTGLKTSIKEGVGYHIDEENVVLGTIYTEVEGQGSNTDFKIVGVISMVITSETFLTSQEDEYDYITARVVDVHYFSEGLTTDFRRNFLTLQLVQ